MLLAIYSDHVILLVPPLEIKRLRLVSWPEQINEVMIWRLGINNMQSDLLTFIHN